MDFLVEQSRDHSGDLQQNGTLGKDVCAAHKWRSRSGLLAAMCGEVSWGLC